MYDFRSILDDRYPNSVIIKLKINCKNTYQNSELLCDDIEVIGEDLHKVMKDCTILISVSYFKFSSKRGINLKLERLSYKSENATNDTRVKFIDV